MNKGTELKGILGHVNKTMERELEGLERLAMPDELHNEECKKAGVELTEDYDLIKKALLELKSIKEANPIEALKYVNGKIADLEDDLQHYTMVEKDKCKEFFIREDLKQFTNIKQTLLNAQEQEKENDILKEIIKSLFDRGCPLHQYVDKDWGLTIEVDDECSIMHLGKYRGVDLDEKLKEVLKK